MNQERKDKIAFAKAEYKRGVHAPKDLQAAVKKKFGSGLAFRDLGTVFPASSKKKAGKKAGRKKSGRPANGAHPRRGRPPAAAQDSLALFYGDEVELLSSRRQVEQRVAELLAEGYSSEDLSVYERTNMKLAIRQTLSI